MTGKPTKNNVIKLGLIVMFHKDIQKKRVFNMAIM